MVKVNLLGLNPAAWSPPIPCEAAFFNVRDGGKSLGPYQPNKFYRRADIDAIDKAVRVRFKDDGTWEPRE